MMPYISGLRADIWKQSSPDERIAALSELENFLAEQEGRQPSQVISADLPSSTRGEHYFQDSTEYIALNQSLVNDSEEPYQATETLFHESRHSYQHHVVENPELAEDQAQLESWQLSENGGYIQPNEINHSFYRWQPVELDANEVARSRTDELYQETFQDTEQYPDYKAQKEQEVADEIEYAKTDLGENYIEEARQAMMENYQRQQDRSNEFSSQETSEITQGSPTDDEEASLSEGEDYDYGYGYGY